jgi:hypothetical protein
VELDELVRLYPRLYHMAAPDAWPQIVRHGLLSTEALLDRFEVAEPQRTELLTRRRGVSVKISHPKHGTAVVRDNIPLSESKLAAALADMTVDQWLRLLNSKVFFWLQRERVSRLLGAHAYRASSHLIITVDTQLLLGHIGDDSVTLSRINTGSTAYRAAPRGRDTFKQISDYTHPPRRRALKSASDIAELSVAGAVADILSVAEYADLHTPDGTQLVWKREPEAT